MGWVIDSDSEGAEAMLETPGWGGENFSVPLEGVV